MEANGFSFKKYMIASILKLLTGKELILYSPHRQTFPLVKEVHNRSRYLFFSYSVVLRIIPFRITDKRKLKVLYLMLKLIKPKLIVGINWIGRDSALFKLWTKNNNSKYIVIQHGSYVGGIVTDISHRYVNCDEFWVWSPYFKNLFESYNVGKRSTISVFGNPIYNNLGRSTYSYSRGSYSSGSILLVPSVVEYSRLKYFYQFIKKLKEIGFEITIKEHNYQNRISKAIQGSKKTTDDVYSLLASKKFDIVISDHSTVLIDAILFKNNVLYFGVPGVLNEYTSNRFTDYLTNVYNLYEHWLNKEEVYNLVDQKAQEVLFTEMVSLKNNLFP